MHTEIKLIQKIQLSFNFFQHHSNLENGSNWSKSASLQSLKDLTLIVAEETPTVRFLPGKLGERTIPMNNHEASSPRYKDLALVVAEKLIT